MEVDASTGVLSFETYGVGLETCPIILNEPAEQILGVIKE